LKANSFYGIIKKVQGVRKEVNGMAQENTHTDAKLVYRKVLTAEELERRIEEVNAGLCMEVTMEELEALEHEPPDGPIFQELKRRHAELKAKLCKWRAEKGYADDTASDRR